MPITWAATATSASPLRISIPSSTGGTLFANIDCQTPLTLPSHTSLFTSTYPFQTHVQENAEPIPARRGHARRRSASTRLQDSRFCQQRISRTRDASRSKVLKHTTARSTSPRSRRCREKCFGAAYRAPHTLRANVGKARSRFTPRCDGCRPIRDQPVFVFIHLFDLHTPYTVPQATAKANGLSRYDAQLALEDEIVGRLKSALIRKLASGTRRSPSCSPIMAKGWEITAKTATVISFTKARCMFRSFFHWPAGYTAQPARVEEPGGLVDVAPTILDFLKVPAPRSFVGTSLLTRHPHPIYSESLHTHDSFGWAPLRSLRVGEYKYIAAPKAELYDLKTIPPRNINLIQTQPARVREMRTQLASSSPTTRRSRTKPLRPSASLETEQVLATLGYLATVRKQKAATPIPKIACPSSNSTKKLLIRSWTAV